jgi:hypothetical protein
MPRIPQFQEQFVSTRVSNPNAGDLGQIIAGVGGLAKQTADVFQQRKLASDMTKVSELSTDFELQMQDEFEAFKQERSGNTDNFSTDFDTLVKERKKEFLAESGLGAQGKLAFSKIAEGKRGSLGTLANEYEAQQQITNFSNSVERTAEKNELLSFRAGENLDIDTLSSVEASVDANVLAGASFVPADQLEKMQKVQTQGAFVNFIKGATGTDIEYAKELVENKDIQNKLGDVETIDMMKSYIRQVEKRQKQLEDDALTDEKNLKKASLDVNTQVALEAEFNKFNIQPSTDKIKNKEFNSMTDMISFRDDVKKAYSNNEITDAQYSTYISDTSPVMLRMIQKGKGDIKNLKFWNTNVNEQIAKDIKNQFKDNPAISDSDLVEIYEDTYKQLAEEEIEVTSVNKDDKLKAQELLDKNIRTFGALSSGRTDTNATIVGNSIVPLNEEAKTKGSQLDNGGFFLEQDKTTGERAYVRRDASGKVLEVRGVK